MKKSSAWSVSDTLYGNAVRAVMFHICSVEDEGTKGYVKGLVHAFVNIVKLFQQPIFKTDRHTNFPVLFQFPILYL